MCRFLFAHPPPPPPQQTLDRKLKSFAYLVIKWFGSIFFSSVFAPGIIVNLIWEWCFCDFRILFKMWANLVTLKSKVLWQRRAHFFWARVAFCSSYPRIKVSGKSVWDFYSMVGFHSNTALKETYLNRKFEMPFKGECFFTFHG